MHCALAAIPGAIAYRANPLTYLLGRMLVQVEYLGIANLLLNEPMYPERIQNAATPAALAAELRACLQDPARRQCTAAQAGRLRALLSVPASGTVADWLARHLAAGPWAALAAGRNEEVKRGGRAAEHQRISPTAGWRLLFHGPKFAPCPPLPRQFPRIARCPGWSWPPA